MSRQHADVVDGLHQHDKVGPLRQNLAHQQGERMHAVVAGHAGVEAVDLEAQRCLELARGEIGKAVVRQHERALGGGAAEKCQRDVGLLVAPSGLDETRGVDGERQRPARCVASASRLRRGKV
jgi:hypothetical protein